MARLFLSYSRTDAARVEEIASALQSAGHDLWWDRKIAGGSEYSGEIEAALGRAEAVIVAWSGSSVRSAWVRDEAAFARDRGRLLPILLDDSGPPLGFRQIHAVDMRAWDGSAHAPEMVELEAAIAARAAIHDDGADAAATGPAGARPAFVAPPLRDRPGVARTPDERQSTRKTAMWLVFGVAALGILSKCDSHVEFTPETEEQLRRRAAAVATAKANEEAEKAVDRAEAEAIAAGDAANIDGAIASGERKPGAIVIKGRGGEVRITDPDGPNRKVQVIGRDGREAPPPSAPPEAPR